MYVIARPDSNRIARMWPYGGWVVLVAAILFAAGWSAAVIHAYDPESPPAGEVLTAVGWPILIASVLLNALRIYVRRRPTSRPFDRLDGDTGEWRVASPYLALKRLGFDDEADELWDVYSGTSMRGDDVGCRELVKQAWAVVNAERAAARRNSEAKLVAERYQQLSLELSRDPEGLDGPVD